jgi:hypothetical protein
MQGDADTDLSNNFFINRAGRCRENQDHDLSFFLQEWSKYQQHDTQTDIEDENFSTDLLSRMQNRRESS